MERKRDGSKLKLVLTGSTIAQMEDLQAEKNPLHGRLRPLPLWPMPFPRDAAATARQHPRQDDSLLRCGRYAPLPGGVRQRRPPCNHREGRRRPAQRQLFDEPRNLLQSELRESAVYFSILAELAGNPQDAATVAAGMRMDSQRAVGLLGHVGVTSPHRATATRGERAAKSRTTRWKCTDHFVRFWFRFVQPFQGELEAGADPHAHVDLNILPHLADHTASAFEDAATAWIRQRHAGSTEVGGWWGGRAPPTSRSRRGRFTEEIDTVALSGSKGRRRRGSEVDQQAARRRRPLQPRRVSSCPRWRRQASASPEPRSCWPPATGSVKVSSTSPPKRPTRT